MGIMCDITMPAQKESLPAVTIAGIVAIVFSLFGLLGSFFAGLSIIVMPQLPTTPGAPPTPPGFRGMMIAMMFFMVALSIFGILVGVNVIRRRNWARFTILVWGGLMAVFCICAVAFSFVVFNVMPEINLPNGRPADVGQVMQFMKVFLIIFYGIPAAVGIWWLVLFTRPRVATAFTSPILAAIALDASGFPQLSVTAQEVQPPRPRCPLPLAIVAGFFILCSAWTLIFLAIPTPYDFPMYWFGHAYSGAGHKFFLALIMLLMGICGIATLKLKPWGLHTLLAVQSIFFVNGLFMALSPGYVAVMRETMEKVTNQYSAFPEHNPFLSDSYIRSALGIGLIFSLSIIALLIFYRSRFLERAAAAQGRTENR